MNILRSCAFGLGVVLGAAPAAAQSDPTPTPTTYAAAVRARYVPLASFTRRPTYLPERLKRQVSVHLERVPLQRAIVEIATQARLGLSYGEEVAAANQRVTLSVDRITAAKALAMAVQGTGWTAMVTEAGQVMVVKTPASGADMPRGSITGLVTDVKTGEKIIGAEVFLDDTQWRTATDTGGRYRFADIDAGTYTLVVRRVGYNRQTRQVVVRAEQEDTVDFALEAVAVALDELITTATGQQRRRDLGNAITTINADSVLQAAPIRNLTDLLEDRVPGLNVQHTSGAPGDPGRLRLRGIGSVLRGNDPIVIVDGVRIYSAQSDLRSGNLTNFGDARTHKCDMSQGGCNPSLGQMGGTDVVPLSAGNVPAPSPLDQIDPNTIEKIEVFKGPSAATLYGADAANGVIVVTTKKGRPGPARWSASVTHARTTTPGHWPEGYYRWGHMPERGGAVQFCTILQSSCVADSLVRFQALNDPDLTVLGRGHRTGVSLTASGGSQALTYSVTGSYNDEVGPLTLPTFEADRFRTRLAMEPPDWMRQPHRLTNWSVASNVRALLGPTADVTLRTSVARSEQQRSTLETQIGVLTGVYVDQINGIYYIPGAVGGSVFPVGQFIHDYYQRTTASAITFTTSLNATWRPWSWFNGSAQAGLNVIPREDETLQPSGFVVATDSGALIRGTGRSLVSTFNLQGEVRKPIGRGFAFQTSVGANLNTTTTSQVVTSATRLQPGTSTIVGAQEISATEGLANTSIFGWYIEPRIVGERLSLSTGIRLDGGSAHGTRLTSSGGLGNLLSLPKLNTSWVISEEPWFPFTSLFSSLRLRAAYGQAQVQPGPADRLRIYKQRIGSFGSQFLKVTNVGNIDLRPERSVGIEGGFDADLFDSRVTLEFTAYRKTQVDAHMPVQLPLSVNGGGTVIQNIGNIRNKGVEVVLGVTPVQTPALTWNTQLMYSRNNNTLVKLGRGVAPNKLQGWVEGYPVSARWAKPILGYVDGDGNGVLDLSEIRLGDSLVYMGRLLPAYTTSLHTNVTLFGGAIGIAASFSYDAGATQVDSTAKTNWILSQALVDPSTPFKEQAAVIALDSTAYGMTQDVSTFRFQSLSINYRAPVRIARLLRAQQMSIGIQGHNLGLNSTYRGKDPDVSAWSPGEVIRDTGQLPLPRTWQLAVRLQY